MKLVDYNLEIQNSLYLALHIFCYIDPRQRIG
jgi:hypothetical protein